MNGDIKLYDNKHSEVLKVSSVNESISCGLYFKSDTLNCNLLVTGSESPNAGLQFGQVGVDRNNYTVVGNANTKVIEASDGVSSLTQNPLVLEQIASASVRGSEINLWNADPSNWQGDDKAIEGTLKR